MRKIVINTEFGCFALSRLAILRAREISGDSEWGGVWKECNNDYGFLVEVTRDDKVLVKVVEELGKAASGSISNLEVISIPEDVEWKIEECNGVEWVSEVHRTWRS